MTKPDKVRAREEARNLIAEYGIVSAPVPVERIAKLRGIKVQFAPLDAELSGMAYVRDRVRFIGVNSLHHPNRQRFTLAHELGHHILHAEQLGETVHVDKVILRRDAVAGLGTDANEVEANNFAAELLMPEDWVAEATGGGFDIGDDEALATLARRFKVSASALQFRLISM